MFTWKRLRVRSTVISEVASSVADLKVTEGGLGWRLPANTTGSVEKPLPPLESCGARKLLWCVTVSARLAGCHSGREFVKQTLLRFGCDSRSNDSLCHLFSSFSSGHVAIPSAFHSVFKKNGVRPIRHARFKPTSVRSQYNVGVDHHVFKH